jgi:hypothetical protein
MAEEAAAVGLKREVDAILRREGKIERSTEGGGMLVGGGPDGEVTLAGLDTGGVSLVAPQSSQSQSELAVAVAAGVVLAAFAIGLGTGVSETVSTGFSSITPHPASKLFSSSLRLVLSSFSNDGHAVTGDGLLGSGSCGNSSLTGVFRPSPGKGLRS